MVASRNRRTEEHKLFIASFRIRKDLVKACSKASPSASKVFWAGGGIVTFPLQKEPSGVVAKHSEHAIGFALTPPNRPANLGVPLE
jgi:hypothetical protein